MTTHTPAIDVSHDQPQQPNLPFSPWLRGQTTLFISQISAILGFVLFIASLVYYVSDLGEHGELLRPATVKLIVDYVHVIFMAVFVLVLIQVLDDNDRGFYHVKLVHERVFGEYSGDYERDLEKSKHQLRLFKRRFLWFWIGMLFLYIFFACQHSYDLATAEPLEQSVHSVNPLFSTRNKSPEGKEGSLKADVGYNTTDKAMTAKSTDEGKNSNPERLDLPAAAKKLAFPFTVFFFNNLTLLFVFWCFLVLYIPADEMAHRYRKYRNGSFLLIGVLTVLFPLLVYIKGSGHTLDEWKDFSAVFDALSGVMNAIVLALLIARLDSKLIGLPSWLISILYSYAAVQPLFMVFELSQSKVLEKIATSVLIFVFVSKIYFFLIIIYALQTGRMLNYLFCFPILRERAKDLEPKHTLLIYFSLITIYALQTGKMLNHLFCFATVRERAKDPEPKHTPLVLESDETEPNPVSASNASTEDRVMRLLARCDKWVRKRLGRKGTRRIRKVRERLSRWLRSDHPLEVSKWLGLTAICYFFISLIVSLLSPKSTYGDWGIGGLHKAVARMNAAFLHLLIPNNAHGDWDIRAIFNVAIDCAQLVAVLGMIATVYFVRKENRYGGHKAFKTAGRIFEETLTPKYPPKEAKRQLKKFKKYFLYFWCVMFLLYIVFLLDHLEIGFCLDKTGSIALTSRILGLIPACDSAPLPGSMSYMIKILLYPFLEFVFGTLNLLFIFWCFVVLRSPAFDKRADKRQKLLVNYSGFVVALLIAAFPLLLFRIGGPKLLDESNMRDYATVFDGLTGTLSAVVLALLVARMDSKLFGLPSWSIGMLFVYASIQPLFVAFALNDTVLKMVQTSVLTAAFGLKICFFLIIAHSLQSGRALNYLVCFPFLKVRVDSIFENQFEIRLARAEVNSYTFSILKKNQLYYSTPIKVKSREQCDRFVHYLRERMRQRDAYLPPPKGRDADLPPPQESGTYWVEVRSDDSELICESIPLKSKAEAHDLIAESMDKIPYCKYNRA